MIEQFVCFVHNWKSNYLCRLHWVVCFYQKKKNNISALLYSEEIQLPLQNDFLVFQDVFLLIEISLGPARGKYKFFEQQITKLKLNKLYCSQLTIVFLFLALKIIKLCSHFY